MIRSDARSPQDALNTPFDNSGTGLSATNLQDAGAELDSRSIHLRKMTLEADFTVQAGYFALWVRPRVKTTTTLRVEAGARLRAMG